MMGDSKQKDISKLYASHHVWDQRFEVEDLDWNTQWTQPFIKRMEQAQIQHVVDLGCGTGNDAMRLANAGFKVTGLDFSYQGLDLARSKSVGGIQWIMADMGNALPFQDVSLEAVMSNVAIHMFPETITRRLFEEIRRVVKPDGLFLFHVNAVEDRPLRAQRKHPIQELEPNYILEEDGQTVRFFSQVYLEGLLAEWKHLTLEYVEICHEELGHPFKRVWRGVVIR